MCQKIEITISPAGTLWVCPTDCQDGGATCRALSAPFQALGRVLGDQDLGNSHVVTIEAVFLDLDALADAVQECGLELVRDQTTYRWYNRSVGDYDGADAAQKHGIPLNGQCLHAIRVPDRPLAYEIGVVANPSGPGFRLVWDYWNRGYGLADHISRHKAGNDMELLQQAYSVAVVRKTMKLKRHKLASEQTLADGTIRLVVSVD